MLIMLAVVLTLLLFAAILAVRSYQRASREPARPRLEARVTTLENVADDLDKRVEYLSSEIKSVRGRQYASEKRSKDDNEEGGAESPGADAIAPNVRSYIPTAHLSRRFKGG